MVQPVSPLPMLQSALGFGEQGPAVERGADGFPLANAEPGNSIKGRK